MAGKRKNRAHSEAIKKRAPQAAPVLSPIPKGRTGRSEKLTTGALLLVLVFLVTLVLYILESVKARLTG